MSSELGDVVGLRGSWRLGLAAGRHHRLCFGRGTVRVKGAELKESFTERLSERHVQNVTGLEHRSHRAPGTAEVPLETGGNS